MAFLESVFMVYKTHLGIEREMIAKDKWPTRNENASAKYI